MHNIQTVINMPETLPENCCCTTFIIIIIMPCGQVPLRPNTKLLQTLRSCVIFTASPILRPVHSVMLSNHCFGCLPRHRTPSIEPNSTYFISRLSGMRQICPNSVSFLCRMVLMIVFCLFSTSVVV